MFPNLQHFAAALISQAAETPAPSGWAETGQLFFPIAMVFIFYVVYLRPGAKERRAHTQLLEALKRGDDVLTSSGLFGKIADMGPKVVTLEIAKNVKVRVLRSAIAKKAEAEEPTEAQPK